MFSAERLVSGGKTMNCTVGKTEVKETGLTVRAECVHQYGDSIRPVCRAGKYQTSSSLQTTDQSPRLKLSISIYPCFLSNCIKRTVSSLLNNKVAPSGTVLYCRAKTGRGVYWRWSINILLVMDWLFLHRLVLWFDHN